MESSQAWGHQPSDVIFKHFCICCGRTIFSQIITNGFTLEGANSEQHDSIVRQHVAHVQTKVQLSTENCHQLVTMPITIGFWSIRNNPKDRQKCVVLTQTLK